MKRKKVRKRRKQLESRKERRRRKWNERKKKINVITEKKGKGKKWGIASLRRMKQQRTYMQECKHPTYDTSEESDTDAVCPKSGLIQIMGLESNVIFGMT